MIVFNERKISCLLWVGKPIQRPNYREVVEELLGMCSGSDISLACNPYNHSNKHKKEFLFLILCHIFPTFITRNICFIYVAELAVVSNFDAILLLYFNENYLFHFPFKTIAFSEIANNKCLLQWQENELECLGTTLAGITTFQNCIFFFFKSEQMHKFRDYLKQEYS